MFCRPAALASIEPKELKNPPGVEDKPAALPSIESKKVEHHRCVESNPGAPASIESKGPKHPRDVETDTNKSAEGLFVRQGRVKVRDELCRKLGHAYLCSLLI